ncbi:aminoglycoside phosphotransferase family protein [Actinoplanes sp. NPDC051475]|uniref:phosphotransferase family protein n=1 Tax=Actinoplanes sp. NPDC051475 TaxID=3157225 RepID=UPI00344BE3B7
MIQAAGLRIGWHDLPRPVRRKVESLIGDRVATATSQRGGFSPGTADRVVTERGRRAFVKAVSVHLNTTSVELARREAHVTGQMPDAAPVPRLLGCFDDGEWMVLVLEDVDGRHPRTPWVDDEVDAAVSALRDLAHLLTPAPMVGVPQAGERLAEQFAGWACLRADPLPGLDPWTAAHLDDLSAAAERGLDVLRTGATVAHCDIRADNLLVRRDGSITVVDWPWACAGPPWLDTVLLAMNVIVHGGDGDRLLVGVDPGQAVDVCAGFAGYLMERSRHPSPGIPYVRDFQRAHAEALLPWLRERLPRRG